MQAKNNAECLAAIIQVASSLADRIKVLETINQGTQDELAQQHTKNDALESEINLCKKKLAIMRDRKQESIALQEEVKKQSAEINEYQKKLQEQTAKNEYLRKLLDDQSATLTDKQCQLAVKSTEADKHRESLEKQLAIHKSLLEVIEKQRKQYDELDDSAKRIAANNKVLARQLAISDQKRIEALRDKYGECKGILRCAICFEKNRQRVAYACSHLAVCRDCDKNIDTCPICRAAIILRLNVILP